MPFVTVTVNRLVCPGNVNVLGFVALATVRFVGALKFNVPITSVCVSTPPSAVMFPAGIVFIQFTAPVATTSKRTSQVPFADISAFDTDIDVAPIVPVNNGDPAHVLCAFIGSARTMPAGSGSVTPIPVRDVLPPFARRIVTVDLPPDDTLVGANVFVADRDDV